MESPFGPTFARNSCVKLYCRYIDDLILIIDNEGTLLKRKQLTENKSEFKFVFQTMGLSLSLILILKQVM